MKRKLSEKKKMMAYVLSTDSEFEYSQKKISNLMDVSQSTVSNAIKDVKHLKEVYDLKNELAMAKSKLVEQYEIVEEPKKRLPFRIFEDE
jgi:predicted transcriptional regulator